MLARASAGIRRFVIREQVACYVDFYREVDAMSEAQALEKDREGENNYLGFRVGDSLNHGHVIHGIVDHEPEGLARA